MTTINNIEVAAVFNSYPEQIRKKLMFLRQLVLDTAMKNDEVGILEETLKWGEPSYIAPKGSTVRIAWKASSPGHYAMYFNCNTRLVDTFRELYPEVFQFAGNRAIVFTENNEIPVKELQHCILLSLTYHQVKRLPMLGA